MAMRRPEPVADGPVLTLTRLLPAPCRLVFAAWTRPEHLARWLGPAGFEAVDCSLDVRPGGAWRATILDPDGGVHAMRGVYREVVPDQRLAFTFAWLDAAGVPGAETLVTIDLAARGEQTAMTFRHAGFADADVRRDHEAGWTSCLDRLAGEVASPPAADVLEIRRLLDAPCERVFRLWTDPAHAACWMGPHGFTAIGVELGTAVGDRWRLGLRPDDGGPVLWQGGRLLALDPPERLSITMAWEDADGRPGAEMLVTVTLAERNGRTAMLFRQERLPSVESREGHRGGWSSAFDRLAGALAASPG